MATNNSPLEDLNNWMKNSVFVKFFAMCILILILLIPLAMVESLINERNQRREEAINEVSSKWSNMQTLTGPVLTLPFTQTEYVINQEGKTEERIIQSYAHFLPDNLNFEGTIKPEERKRGIYEVVVYNADLLVTGSFRFPQIKNLDIKPEQINWEGAFLSFGISDLRGIQENVQIAWNDTVLNFDPGVISNDVLYSGVNTKIPDLRVKKNDTYQFRLKLNLNGSNQLLFSPLGKETIVKLNSKWKNPSFDGAFLPDDRTVSDSGFNAVWKVLHLNRNFAQQWKNQLSEVNNWSFGVNLLLPVDEYQKSIRSAKYGIMIIALTFLVFFFVEVLNKTRIHPIQYLLVGLGLVIFYSLLIAISEHINFNSAYLIAGISVVALISGYSHSIFKKRNLTGLLLGILILLYGFNYTLLQLQDYALLIGNIGLFIVLAIVMYLSRKINWYGKDKKDDDVQIKENQ